MIGVFYPDQYAVEETFQLLKIPWEWYVPGHQYRVVIAKRKDLPDYSGPLIDITDNDIFEKIRYLLNTGESHLRLPLCDIAIDALRKELMTCTPLAEIPPAPWNYSYMVALTHDVDAISIRKSGLRSVAGAAFRCFLQMQVREGAGIVLAKLGLVQDPWDLSDRWKTLEDGLHVRSTFYFVPRKDDAGILSHPFRAVHYDLNLHLIRRLVAEGWEAGVHGIDNWIDPLRGKEELQALHLEGTGNRTHWLLFNAQSWINLDRAGYAYDSTFGYNDDVGFRAGTMQVYRPEGVLRILELPLHIQDIALFNTSCFARADDRWEKIPCLNLTEPDAKECCERILDLAKKYGGEVTLLWHFENLVAPHDWSRLYIHLVSRAKNDGAWITKAMDIVSWFRARRETKIGCSVHEKLMTITLRDYDFTRNPLQKVRIHIDPASVLHADSEYVTGDRYVDIKCDREIITLVLK